MSNQTIEKISKITSQGQITLPASWRRKFKSNQVVMRSSGNTLEVSPIVLPAHNKSKDAEYTVFDAIRDNKGKGIKADDLSKILKKLNK